MLRGEGRRRPTGAPAVSSGGGAPVVLVTGDDALGVERAARKFAGEVADPALLRTVRVLGVSRPAALAEERAAAALEAVATGSLFGDGAFVVVADAPSLLGTEVSKQVLLEAVGLVAEGNVLALLALADESGRPRAGLAELRAAVEAAGGSVRTASLPADLARWIGETAPEMGVRLGRGAAGELARRLGGQERTRDVDRRGMAAEAVAELTKLGLYREGGEVSVDDVRALVMERLPASVFDMLDAIGARRPQPAIRLMERATATVPGPVLVVRIHRRLRELVIVGDLTASGATQVEIAKALEWKGTPSTLDWRVDRHRQQAAAWSPGELVAALDGLLDVDAAMKGEGQTSERAQRLALVLWIVERVSSR